MSAGNAAPAALTEDSPSSPERPSQVLAAGTLVDVSDYESNPARFSRELSRAKAEHGFALCLCSEPRPQLVIRRIGSTEGDRYFLATWPNNGTAHARACRFFRSEEQYEDARTRALAAVLEGDDGFNIKPGFSLRRLELADSEDSNGKTRVPSTASAGHEVAQRNSLSLAETLAYLWGAAGLGQAIGGRRWSDAVTSLASVMAQGSVGRTSLASVLYLVPVFEAANKDAIDTGWSNFLTQFHRTERAVPLFLVLGEVKTTQRAGQAVATYLRHFAPPLFMSTGLAGALADRYPAAEACLADRQQSDRVIGLFQCEISARGKLWVNDAALLRVTGAYAPLAAAATG